MDGLNENGEIGALKSKKPPEGGCAECGGMLMVSQD
jgi:hypothetical protein